MQTSFLDATNDEDLLEELGLEDVTSAEGFLFPDTYQFIDKMKGERVVTTMVRTFQKRWDALSAKQKSAAASLKKEMKWGTKDIVTLASIVEKEAGVASERPIIAGVFFNRLRSRTFLPQARLQADPTVSFGCIEEEDAAKTCKGFSGKISRAMLEDDDNRYNTYRHSGLPPGPIANPGLAALKAVLVPKKHRYFYFVARGGGRHEFSATLNRHNKAVKQFIRTKN